MVGEAEVVREGHPDPTQFDRKDDHYDPDSPADDPRWFQVELKGLRKFPHPVTLAEIKAEPDLREMLLIRRGMRLSVQPVTKEQYQAIVRMAR